MAQEVPASSVVGTPIAQPKGTKPRKPRNAANKKAEVASGE